MAEIVIHTGDVLLICLVQMVINILSFGWGKRSGLAQSLREFEAISKEIEILEITEELTREGYSCSDCGEELIFGDCPNCYPKERNQ